MVEQARKLHLGCGLNTPGGRINLDGSWNAWVVKHPIVLRVLETLHLLPASLFDVPWSHNVLIHDVRKPLPFQGSSLSAIYASHLLEHLYLEEAKRLLKECFRVLQPGGVLRMVVPDLQAVVLEYMGEKPFGNLSDGMGAIHRADRLNKRLGLRGSQSPSGNIFYRIYSALKAFHSHKWMYDADSLITYFERAGFTHVQEMELHRSRIGGIEKLEQAKRVLNGAGICIEGVKPDMVT